VIHIMTLCLYIIFINISLNPLNNKLFLSNLFNKKILKLI
jgi:hypothetical protein